MWMRSFVILLLTVIYCANTAYGEEKDDNVSAAVLLDYLVNASDAPRISKEGDLRRVVINQSFKWSEQERIRDAINRVVAHIDDAWPEVVKHLDDKRYAITTDCGGRLVRNWAVGDVCRTLCMASLNCFDSSLSKNMRSKKSDFHIDDPIVHDLNKWLAMRVSVPLDKLQIERCNWAISTIRERKVFGEAAYIEPIQQLIESIEKEKRAAALYRTRIEVFDHPLTLEQWTERFRKQGADGGAEQR
jgi:hypothetical protein